jgi:hypothetical protein
MNDVAAGLSLPSVTAAPSTADPRGKSLDESAAGQLRRAAIRAIDSNIGGLFSVERCKNASGAMISWHTRQVVMSERGIQ